MSTEPRQLTTKERLDRFGDAGTEYWGGFFQEEPNQLWRDDTRIDTIEEMRRGDGSIKAVLNAIKTPILATEYMIAPASDDPKDQEIADFVEENLFHMRRSFKEFLREALGYLDFGFYPFEKIWEMREGKVILADLEPRIPHSVHKWTINSGKELGITQFIRNDQVHDERSTSFLEIPWNKLLVLTNDKEGDDYTGQSILRSAYIHYYIKNKIYKLQGISMERNGVGIPLGTYPEGGIGQADKNEFEKMLKNMRANQQQYMVVKEGYKVEILTPKSNAMGDMIKSSIDHHSRQIMLSVLAEFLNLGADSTGSFALSKDQSSFFLQHLEEKAVYMTEQINQQVIKEIVDLNFGEVTKYPKLKFASLGTVDFKEFAEVMQILVNSGFVSPAEEEVDEFVRKTMKLPARSEDETPSKQKPKEDAELTELAQKKNPFWRKLTEPEQKVDWHLLNESFDQLEEKLGDILVEFAEQDIQRTIKKVEKGIKQEDLSALAGLAVISMPKTRDALKGISREAHEIGKTTATNELGVDRPTTPSREKQIMNFEADELVEAYNQSLTTRTKETAKNGFSKGVAATAIVGALNTDLRNRAAALISGLVGIIVGQNINRGRRVVFEKNANIISGYMRSEILDGRTCNICMSLDRRIIPADEPFAKLDLVHTNCRGGWVPLTTKEFATPIDDPFKKKQIIPSEEVKKGTLKIPKTIQDQFDTVGGVPVVNSFKQLKKVINRGNADVQREIKERISSKS